MSAAALPAKPTSSAPLARQRPTGPTIVRWTGTVLIGAWASFWTWFAASVAVSEGGQSWLYGGGLCVIALGLVGVVIRWPRAGGVAAVLLGAASMLLLTYPNVWMMMGLPLVVGGVLAAVGGRKA